MSHISELRLDHFRNYTNLSLKFSDKPVIFSGANGSGKTNILEAISYLSEGRGMRRASLNDVVYHQGDEAPNLHQGFAIFSKLQMEFDDVAIGVGGKLADPLDSSSRISKEIRIDGSSYKNSTILSQYMRCVWLTPALDRLFTGPTNERRKFFDRFVGNFDPSHNARISRYEKTMRERNKLLEQNMMDDAWLTSIEVQMAEQAVGIAAIRQEVALHLSALLQEGDESAFPFAKIAMDGDLEAMIGQKSASDVEDFYLSNLKQNRSSDQALGRCQMGPHKSDLLAWHGSKNIEAKKCSTGEQKALLIAILLAHARLIKQVAGDACLVMLLDEITAHLDRKRSFALFDELTDLGAQLFMTGTDIALFSAISDHSDHFEVDDGKIIE